MNKKEKSKQVKDVSNLSTMIQTIENAKEIQSLSEDIRADVRIILSRLYLAIQKEYVRQKLELDIMK